MSTSHTQPRIVILGGGYAGLIAAARMRRADTQASITLVDAKPEFVHRIRLHEMLAGSRPHTLPYAPLLQGRGITFVQGFVAAIEPAQQRVIGQDHTRQPFALDYDYLIVALGSYSTANVPGVADHAVRLNDPVAIQQAQLRLHELARTHGRVLIAGGGLSGIETATEIAERMPGLRITLATHDQVGAGYAERARQTLRRRFRELGVDVLEETKIIGIDQQTAYTAGNDALPFELCVWTAGFTAQPLARDAGFAVDGYGRIVVNAYLQAIEQPNVFAVGDAAAAERDGRTIRMGCVSALPMGAYVGDALGRRLHGNTPPPFAFDYPLRCISLGRRGGIVQRTRPDDTPIAQVWTGVPAVALKAAICRLTFDVVHSELRLGRRLFYWTKAAHMRSMQRMAESQA